jgi:hypothetical protein
VTVNSELHCHKPTFCISSQTAELEIRVRIELCAVVEDMDITVCWDMMPRVLVNVH